MIKTTPLDPKTYGNARRVLAYATSEGLDPVEALHRAGLLVDEEKARLMREDGIRIMVDSIKVWSPADFLARKRPRGFGASPADMYEQIVAWMEEVLEATRMTGRRSG